MELSKIGFIGFGEVGTVFIGAMSASGADVVVYDVLLEDEERTDALIRRTGEAGCRLGTLREVLLHGDIILSAVTTQAAKKVAETCAPLLRPTGAAKNVSQTMKNFAISSDQGSASFRTYRKKTDVTTIPVMIARIAITNHLKSSRTTRLT